MAARPSDIIEAMSEARAACVIGWPVAHSRSPMIHGYWIKHHKLAADYRREALEPAAVADLHGAELVLGDAEPGLRVDLNFQRIVGTK